MNTKALRQKILDLAIHGKLVPQDPNDEPASVLLERIRDEKERLIKEGKIKRSKKTKATSDKPHYENEPFEVPSSWVWCKLHDIIQITNGRSQKYVENVNGKYPIYGSGGIIGKAVDYLCEAGSTIIGRKGTINNPLFVKERFWNIDTAFGMKPMYAISDLYFFYFCQYFDFSKLDKSTAVPSLTQSAIGEVFIPIPPIKEQKRITDEISYWLGFIDTLESNLINLQLAIKQTKSKILDLAIHGKLVPQYPTDEPASELLKRINPKAEITCDNGHYQKLPEGWAVCQLDSIISYEQPTPYIVKSTDYDDTYTTPVLTAGKSFIIGHTNETNGIYEKLPCIIFDDFTTDSKLVDFPFKVKSSAMKILQVKEDINIEYIAMFMSITRLIGDTHKRYWISEYSKIEIPIPPKNEQDRIVKKVRLLINRLGTITENL